MNFTVSDQDHSKMEKKFVRILQLLKDDKLAARDAVECSEVYYAVQSSSLFSSNEDSYDIHPFHMKYVLLDFMYGSLHEIFNCNRLDNLKRAYGLYISFLLRSIQYDLVRKALPEYSEISRYFQEDKDEDDLRKERFEQWLQLVPRDLKIDRMRRIIKLKNYEIPKCDHDEEVDDEDLDESYSVVWMKIIELYILMTVDRLGMILKEIELLEFGSGDAEEPPTDPIKFDSIAAKPSTKFDKPFKLVKDRKQVADGVFQYGHNLPTMTIDEYLDLERKRGNFISGGGAASAHKKEIDEDDQVEMEIELKKARDFDEIKDMYARGSGNTYNRS